MAEHVDQSEAVENFDPVQSYLDEYTQVDTHSENEEDVSEKEVDSEEDEKDTPEEGEKKDVDQDKGEKQIDDPVEKEGETSANKSIKSLKEIPKGFESVFFNKDEDGSIAFKREDAMKFLLPESGKQRFEYNTDNRLKFVSEDPNKKQEPEDQYEKFVSEEKEFRSAVKENMYTFPNTFKEVYDKTGDVNQAYTAAYQEVTKIINDEFEDRDLRRGAEYQKMLESKFGATKSEEAMKESARSNEALLMNEIAQSFSLSPQEARDSYVALMKDGLPILQMQFEIANPDKVKNVTTAEYNKAFSNWWNRIASNNDHLRFMYGQILNDVNTKLQPYMQEGYKSKKAKTAAENRRAKTSRPSNKSRQAQKPVSKGVNDVLEYFNMSSGSADVL